MGQILLIDDDQDIRHGAKLRLQSAGHTTVLASDGEQGLRTAINTLPDAVVLDVRMPKRSGLQVLNDLKRNERTRSIPVIMLSASLVDQESALEAGAQCFLRKPYAGSQLVETVEAALSLTNRIDQLQRVDASAI